MSCCSLLEMQRHAMLMYTSCGWFFDELSGIETVQVIQYAARAIQLADESVWRSPRKSSSWSCLSQSPTNIPEYQNGAEIYSRFVQAGDGRPARRRRALRHHRVVPRI